MKHISYIALGSNVGDRFEYLRKAVMALHDHTHISVLATSSIYETDPVGYVKQACFLNMVVKVATSLSPFALLAATMDIEKQFGRKRDVHWGPRTLDLDILLYNHENIETEQLIIPHPRMLERAFVLIPLFEIDESLIIPSVQRSLRSYVEQLSDQGVRIWKSREAVTELFILSRKGGV
ncbi:2-amino-4-hydroxy-6-hydroxymethyldihydropteridine diphosphokinase [Anoxybacillus mongoliensis]|uniref:2-amino-4-hydroxy-6-hydroxymethyldihydropteridine diphosphokinase n=1 Tax=Anoxybacillus mongoliensis TaxID=452565 RepID=A0A7W8N9G8_9BACL|nr:2-amino-4-hydroxy-6-hydroxymethyldihydropteridine diphosphokinase [Anoxybacillus mongoliensis]MBB5356578.1 2-amino-4-hydroxy-6-hydroxymethyldihydropteridine diphosphokinase [Anoxybacillus mongoliensis]MCX8002906.1 2-amino-4-hydroxy-6-hydroxymethyldihydropteridine diphosphokinase [Anoxybacillus mongoliensis]